MRNVKRQNDQVYAALRQRKVGWCITDSPINNCTVQPCGSTNSAHCRLNEFHGMPKNARGVYPEQQPPNLPDLPKLDFTATSDLSYFRLHGRNADLWYKGDNVTRYDYLYSDSELQAFIDPIRYLLANSKVVAIFWNNHAKNQATVNAKRFEMMLRE